MPFDITLSQYFFAWGRTLPSWLVIFLASWLVWIEAAAVLFLLKRLSSLARRQLLLALAAAVILALFANTAISVFYFRLRPFAALDFLPPILVSPLSKSFPSDHAAAAFALAAIVFRRNTKIGRWLLLAAVLAAFGRVLAGVHYLSDVVAGAVVGALSALAADQGFKFYEPQNRG